MTRQDHNMRHKHERLRQRQWRRTSWRHRYRPYNRNQNFAKIFIPYNRLMKTIFQEPQQYIIEEYKNLFNMAKSDSEINRKVLEMNKKIHENVYKVITFTKETSQMSQDIIKSSSNLNTEFRKLVNICGESVNLNNESLQIIKDVLKNSLIVFNRHESTAAAAAEEAVKKMQQKQEQQQQPYPSSPLSPTPEESHNNNVLTIESLIQRYNDLVNRFNNVCNNEKEGVHDNLHMYV